MSADERPRYIYTIKDLCEVLASFPQELPVLVSAVGGGFTALRDVESTEVEPWPRSGPDSPIGGIIHGEFIEGGQLGGQRRRVLTLG